MDKTIRWNVDLEEQQAETYRYWQNVSVAERLQGVWEVSRDAYSLKGYDDNAPRLPRHLARVERPERKMPNLGQQSPMATESASNE
jgi:hypothetical protein